MRRRLPIILFAAALVVSVLGVTPLGQAAERAISTAPGPGSLDPTFGGGGWSSAGFPSSAAGVAVQPDGKIVVAGPTASHDFGVARITAAGVYDDSFGSGGQASVHFALGAADARALALQPDGKIVVAGEYVDNETHERHLAVARVNPDGSLDTTFGSGGKALPPLRGWTASGAYAVAVEADGKIVAGGYVFDPDTGTTQFVVARLTSSGQLDTSFGGLGWSSAGFPAEVLSLAIQPDGKIVIAGNTAQDEFAVARITADGVYDDSFGSGGQVTVRFPGNQGDAAFPHSLALQNNGKIVVAGTTYANNVSQQADVTRLNPDGSLDSTFGQNGLYWYNLGAGDDAASVAVSGDGEIIVGGTTNNAGD